MTKPYYIVQIKHHLSSYWNDDEQFPTYAEASARVKDLVDKTIDRITYSTPFKFRILYAD